MANNLSDSVKMIYSVDLAPTLVKSFVINCFVSVVMQNELRLILRIFGVTNLERKSEKQREPITHTVALDNAI